MSDPAQLEDVRRLWWGFDGSYVMEREDGRVLWELRGNYGSLESVLLDLETSQYSIKVRLLLLNHNHAVTIL